MKLQFDIKRINLLKDLVLRLRHGEMPEVIRIEIEETYSDVSDLDFRLTVQELLKEEHGVTIEDAKRLFSIYPHSPDDTADGKASSMGDHPGHPVQIFKEENRTFSSMIVRMGRLMDVLEQEYPTQHADEIDELKQLIFRLGELHKHYHRKEKLFFPIMERYGYYNPIRTIWRADDQIRALYKGAKRQISQLPDIEFSHVRITYDRFAKEFTEMIFQEEAIILPVLLATFQDDDWMAIAKESDAFGYVRTDKAEEWVISSYSDAFVEVTEESKEPVQAADSPSTSTNLPFGGGYLTTEEANLILNNLPLEITFVDKNMVFKYFNKITEASDMILVRTPISIGRNVANCHPPKSLKKVMTLMRDLKAKRRTSESMWFKKQDQYVHITYKALFNDEGEYLGILEYVQDIQPFFNLPSDVKRVLSDSEE